MLVEAAVEVGTGLLSTALCSVHLLRSFIPSALQLGRCAVDGGEILVVVRGLQSRGSSLDLGLVISGDLVAELLELFLGVEHQRVSVVQLVDLLLGLLVGVGVGLGLGFMRLISSSLKPEEASILIFCSLPEALS